MTPAETKTLTDVELVSIGTDIQFLSNAALAALRNTVSNPNLLCSPHKAQIESITPTQISALTPAQVRFIGSAETGVSKIAGLNSDTFTTLVSNTAQVAALTVAEVGTLPSSKFVLIANNFSALTDAVIASLKETVISSPINTVAQIYSITPEQIDTLTPARVRLLGSSDTGLSKIAFLNPSTFARLVSNPQQVAALTVAEIATLNSTQFSAVGTNFNLLGDDILASLKATYNASPTNSQSQIAGITPAQIALLTPAQVRLLGSADGISKINFLAANTFAQLASDSAQVAAITPLEITTLYTDKIKGLGTNISYLSDAALGNFNYTCPISISNPQCQVGSIEYVQIPAFSQAQIMIIAAMNAGKGIAYLSPTAFGGLQPTQVTALMASHVVNVSAAQLAALREATLSAFPVATISAFTPAQKSMLTASQHTACGC